MDSLLIRNGRILDPEKSIDKVGELLVCDGKIAPAGMSPPEGTRELNADGCLVVPGLVDFHAHLAFRLTDTGVNPDLMALPNGITASVDAGSVGTASARAFVADIVARSEITIKAFLNVSAVGVSTELHSEHPNPANYDARALTDTLKRHADVFIGLKVRLGKGFSDGFGLSSFRRAKEIAAANGKPLCVHATNPDFTIPELLAELEAGDILCHCFQGLGRHTILDGSGAVAKEAWRARERGVIFDAAVGRVNHDFAIVRKALAEGFLPDIVSTDVVAESLYDRKLFHLVRVMSTFLAFGMPLPDVVRCCTATPARHMGIGGERGTLAAGAVADIAILRFLEKSVTFTDRSGSTVAGNGCLAPLATILGGRIVYEQIDFEY